MFPEPTFTPSAQHSSGSVGETTWEIRDDVLRRTTYVRTHTVSEYATPYDGRAREDYLGEVSVDRRTHAQHAHAVTTFDLAWPGTAPQVRSMMDVSITGPGSTSRSRPSRSGTVRWSRHAPGGS